MANFKISRPVLAACENLPSKPNAAHHRSPNPPKDLHFHPPRRRPRCPTSPRSSKPAWRSWTCSITAAAAVTHHPHRRPPSPRHSHCLMRPSYRSPEEISAPLGGPASASVRRGSCRRRATLLSVRTWMNVGRMAVWIAAIRHTWRMPTPRVSTRWAGSGVNVMGAWPWVKVSPHREESVSCQYRGPYVQIFFKKMSQKWFSFFCVQESIEKWRVTADAFLLPYESQKNAHCKQGFALNIGRLSWRTHSVLGWQPLHFI